jgi:small subunit ribosomal protein S13
MARVAGVEIPDNKRIEVALTYIYGLGRNSAQKVLKMCNISFDVRAKDLTSDDLARLRSTIEDHFQVEGELRKVITGNIKRLREIKSYRGLRHMRGLPVRGQQTQTNARTRKGRRR